MKKFLAVLLALLMLSSTAAFTYAADEGTAENYKEEIIIGLSEEFDTIDPQGSNADRNFLIQDNVFDQLCDTDLNTMSNQPELCEYAKSVEPDLWEFKLKDNINFHDGSKLDTDDVEFTLERAKNSEFCTSYISQIIEFIKVDDLTFQLKLAAPNLDFNYTISNNQLAILSKDAFENMPEEQACTIGTGPWKFEEYVPGEYVSLVRFEDSTYYKTPNTKRLVFKFLPEASSRLIALQTGEIDICMNPASIDFATIEADENLSLKQIAGRGLRYIGFNMDRDTPFQNVLVRKAVAAAVNRDDIVLVATGGYGEKTFNCLSKGCANWVEIEGIPEDLEQAKAWMAEAGYPDGFSVSLYYQNDSERSDIAAVVQDQLAAIGINVTLKGLDAAAFSDAWKVNNEHDFCLGRWTPSMNADSMFRNSLSSTAGTNYAHCHDEKLDELLNAANTEVDPEKRAELYADLQHYISEDLVPWVPLYLSVNSVATRANVEGLGLHPAALHHFKYVQVPLS